VHTSNNFAATFDFVEAAYQHSTLLPKLSNEFIVKFRPFDKVECCFDIVTGFGNNVASFGNNVEATFNFVE